MDNGIIYPVWLNYVDNIERLLAGCEATGSTGENMAMDAAFDALKIKGMEAAKNRGEIMFIGNGASASIASHCAADVMKNSRVRTRVFTDVSMITAMGNDEGYENSFMVPVRFYSSKYDLLIAISSSGKSENILRAVAAAHENGAFVATLSAFSPDNPLRASGDLNLYIQTAKYGYAESCHATILHYWMDILSAARENDE